MSYTIELVLAGTGISSTGKTCLWLIFNSINNEKAGLCSIVRTVISSKVRKKQPCAQKSQRSCRARTFAWVAFLN